MDDILKISQSDKNIYQVIRQAYTNNHSITRFWDENEKSEVAIASCPDYPFKGVTSFSTLGLSRATLFEKDVEFKNSEGVPVGVELLGACNNQFEIFGDALSTAAFCIINSKWFCCPGVIYPNILSTYDTSLTMKHLMFFPQIFWQGEFESLIAGGKYVTWLQAVPISDVEYNYAVKNGTYALEDVFIGKQVDVCDLNRKSAVKI